MPVTDLTTLQELDDWPRARLATLPTPMHRLARLSELLEGPEIWVKRDDLTGLAEGGNKTRKLEFLIGDALHVGADTLVSVGAVQSNHTRQVASAAARVGLECVLLHNAWTPWTGAYYERVGNILVSELLGAEIVYDATPRPLGDAGHLRTLVDALKRQGRRPYLIPGGASDHRLGGFGYFACAAETIAQSKEYGVAFDYIIHCTGSSGTQAGLLAGLATLGISTRVIGISDDNNWDRKRRRILRLANSCLGELGMPARVSLSDVIVQVVDPNPYGVAAPATFEAIRLFARAEGIVTDPVYGGKAVSGLIQLTTSGRLRRGQRVLLFHLGGTPAVHAYADQFEHHPPSPIQKRLEQ